MLRTLFTFLPLDRPLTVSGIAMKKSKQELLMLGDSRELSSDAPTTTSSLLTRRGGANVPTSTSKFLLDSVENSKIAVTYEARLPVIYVMSVLTMTVLAWIL